MAEHPFHTEILGVTRDPVSPQWKPGIEMGFYQQRCCQDELKETEKEDRMKEPVGLGCYRTRPQSHFFGNEHCSSRKGKKDPEGCSEIIGPPPR